MKILPYRSYLRASVWTAADCLLALLLAVFPASALAQAASGPKAEKIHVTADRLVAKSKANMAEFVGNVRVTQGDTTIRADRIKIYTKKTGKGAASNAAGKEAIDRILAEGNVRISLKDGVAESEQAEYQADKRVIVLSGPEAKVTRGGNSIIGSRITLYRDDGRINVDGSDRQRVEAVFVTEDRLIE
jgi:lipopolysaccharide export system protein LptA